MATKAPLENMYGLGSLFSGTGAYLAIFGGSVALWQYPVIKRNNSLIDLAKNFPETIKLMNIELKKIDLTKKRKQLEEAKKEVEKELKKLSTQ